MTASICESLNAQIEQMNSLSMKLIASKQFKRIVIEELPKVAGDSGKVNILLLELYDMMSTELLNGFSVGYYDYNGYYLWLGTNYSYNKFENSADIPTVYNDYSGRGAPQINTCKVNPFLNYFKSSDLGFSLGLRPILNFYRSISYDNSVYNPKGILEVHLTDTKLNLVKNELTHDSMFANSSVYVLNAKQEILIPVSAENLSLNIVENDVKAEKGSVAYFGSIGSTDLTFYLTVPFLDMYFSLFLFLFCMVIFCVLFELGLLKITKKLSLHFTAPLEQICENIKTFQVSDYGEKTLQENSYAELDEFNVLSTTFEDLRVRLSNTLDALVQSRALEVQSRMLALQAQMEPHFLFNTLNTIAALSEENNSEQVIEACNQLTNMFRYVGADNPEGVTFLDEINHLISYCELIKLRFNNLVIDMNFDYNMYNIVVPKLIVQPLVENCIKYVSKANCHITVVGTVCEDKWEVSVTDNGDGFSGEKLTLLKEKFSAIDGGTFKTPLSIDGMGMINIYSRLKYFYGDAMVFKISNSTSGGACVKIGGKRG